MRESNDMLNPSVELVSAEVGEELLARLDLMSIKPKVIFDAGCGVGTDILKLQKIYPEAQIITELPAQERSVDMIISNMLLPWHNQHEVLFKAWHRVMRADGLMIFSSLGPDTLKHYPKSHEFMDMHDIGDLLLQCGFADPVLDVSYITLSYRDPKKFHAELSGLIVAEVEAAESYDAQFEIVYGHAFVADKSEQTTEDGVTYVPISHLRRQLMK